MTNASDDLRGLAELDQFHGERIVSREERERWEKLNRELREAEQWGREARAKLRRMQVYP